MAEERRDLATERVDPPPEQERRVRHRLMLEFGSREEWDDPKLEWRRLFSELLGTFFLVLVAAGGGILVGEGQISLAAAVVAPGLMVMAIILFMGAVSGAHLNPAVSLAFALRGDFPWRRVPGYIIVQLVAATLACLFLDAVFGNIQHLGATLPGAGYENWQALLMEIALTAGLVSVILGTASAAQNVGAIAALGVGGYIALAGPLGGAGQRRVDEPGTLVRTGAGQWRLHQLLGLCRGPDRRRVDRRRLRVRPSRSGWRSDREGSGLRRTVAGELGREAATVGADRTWRGAAARHRRARAAQGVTHGLTGPRPMSPSRSQALDHVVLVLFENRSLDNLLGHLYGPEDGKTFEGVIGKDLSNPIPDWAEHGAERKAVPYTVTTDMDAPNPDSGEEYFHTNTQLYNTLDEHNRFKIGDAVTAPWNAPPPGTEPTMDGFVTDYISTFTGEVGRQPTYEEYAQIMTGYTPEQVPVLSGVAKGFGVFDHWFCEVPSQTFMNRSFWTAGTSSGFVVNSRRRSGRRRTPPRRCSTGWRRTGAPGRSTCWSRLASRSRAGSTCPGSRTAWRRNIVPFSEFERDAANGTLPDFSLIEPTLIAGHGDYHPAWAGR